MSKKAIATEADGTMSTKDKVLHSAAVMFLERGYEKTSIREIADHAGVNRGSVLFAIKSKEHLLCMLVAYVLEGQFETSKKLMAGKTADPVLYYAVETALQLYMAESSEAVRELYAVAYSLPSTSELIYRMVTEKLERIFNHLGYDLHQSLVLHVNFGILEDECCRMSFLRGAFLAGGSVTDPEKRYHLELTTSHAQASREMSALLVEMGFQPRHVMRGGNSVTYFKQCEHIEDLLTTIGAPAAAVEMMTTKLEKEMVNNANRAMNCDMANVNKTLDAAAEQSMAIEILRDAGRLDLLPKQIRETALLRLQYPELSLGQLAERCSPPVTKSCINHRMRKIMEIARDLDE